MHRVEDFLNELASISQVITIYDNDHPKTREAFERVYRKLDDILTERGGITIGIVGGEFIFGKDVFFDLSDRLSNFIKDLEEKGIEKMIFSPGLTKKELEKFIRALISRKEDIAGNFRDYLRSLDLEKISIEKIKISGEIEKKEEEPVAWNYEDTLRTISDSFGNILQDEVVDIYKTRAAMKEMLNKVFEGRWDFLSLTSLKDHDLSTFSHSLNVAVLSMFFTSILSFNRENVLDVGVAGLFHDMGKIAISKTIIQKPGKLTDEELNRIRSHTTFGAEILLKYVDSIGILPALVAFEHHLRYDTGGYPKLTYPRKPHRISSIVSICDCYDALRERRSYKKDYPPEMIYQIMFKEKGGLFDPTLFDKFFESLGVYPIGTVVELENGSIGIIREQNEKEIILPKVEIIAPEQEKGTVVDLKKNRNLSIKRSLNPFTEGSQYLPFI